MVPEVAPESGETVRTALSDLLKLLLCLPHETPVAATPSFGPWVNRETAVTWPPAQSGTYPLLLVDTRDRAARRHPDLWAAPGLDHPAFSAAMILTGSGAPGTPLRRVLRRLRYPGTQRLPESEIERKIRVGTPFVHRLAFKDDIDVPAAFELAGNAASTGAAFLITKRPPFSGPLWSRIAQWLSEDSITVESFQLRVRGAAVVALRAGPRRFIVRIVPPGSLQEVVGRNHSALLQLRESLRSSDLLDLMPAPVFSEHDGATQVLGESMLEGALAWRVALRGLAPVVHGHALDFLDRLREATARRTTLGPEQIRRLLHEDQALLTDSTFVSPEVLRLLRRELQDATAILDGCDVALHTSHGDFGYGNLLVDEQDGRLTGVIDWDTARVDDFPGIDRINFEVQNRRSLHREAFASAVESVWRLRAAHPALQEEGSASGTRALFGVAVCRYIIRSLRYPDIYARESAGFERALRWLARTGP